MEMDFTISEERMSIFRSKMWEAFRNVRRHAISVEELTKSVNANNAEIFSKNEINAALSEMAAAKLVMVANGAVYLTISNLFSS